MKKSLIAAGLILTASLSFSQAGFGWLGPKGDDAILPDVDPVKVSGNIITAGSSTVYPLTEALVERFKNEGYKGNITIDSIGTGAGFERFTKSGESDIANASRGIKATEIANGAKIGRVPLEFRVGTDALAIVVAKSNTFAQDLTAEEIAKAFSTAVFWSDVRPSFPKEKIKRYSPGTDSGTFDYFVEHFFKNDKNPILLSAGTQFSEDDNVLVTGVEGSPYAIGYFGYAYYEENKGKLNVLKVNGVTPNTANVNNGTYSVARPLFIYSDAKILQTKPQVAAFIAFYLTYVNEEIKRVGYFPAPATALDASKKIWINAVKPRVPSLK